MKKGLINGIHTLLTVSPKRWFTTIRPVQSVIQKNVSRISDHHLLFWSDTKLYVMKSVRSGGHTDRLERKTASINASDCHTSFRTVPT